MVPMFMYNSHYLKSTPLEDAWVDIALGDEQEAQRKIRSIPKRHPFDERYSQVANIDWDSCSKVLDAGDRRKMLMGGW